MNFKLFGIKTLVFGVALAVGVVVGTLGYHIVVQASTVHAFPKNQNGQTYGSKADATSLDTEPDLISAVGIGGISGYVKRTDLDQSLPKTPEEAVALTKYNLAHSTREIPLYAIDGKTVIGKFIVGGGETKEFKTVE